MTDRLINWEMMGLVRQFLPACRTLVNSFDDLLKGPHTKHVILQGSVSFAFEEQCCYDKEEYCGWGPNAYTRACRKCKDTLTQPSGGFALGSSRRASFLAVSRCRYCEEKLGISRSSVTRDEWNRRSHTSQWGELKWSKLLCQ